MLNDAREHTYSYRTLSDNTSNFSNLGVNFDYQHSFKKKGEYLTLSYKFNNSPDGGESTTSYQDIDNYPTDLYGELRKQYYDNDAHTSEHTAQVDYVNPINDMHYVDAGLKYIYRLNASDSKYYREDDNGAMQPAEDLSSKFDQGQNILAAYADYQLKWKNSVSRPVYATNIPSWM